MGGVTISTRIIEKKEQIQTPITPDWGAPSQEPKPPKIKYKEKSI